jgi:hypothetical protein
MSDLPIAQACWLEQGGAFDRHNRACLQAVPAPDVPSRYLRSRLASSTEHGTTCSATPLRGGVTLKHFGDFETTAGGQQTSRRRMR